MSTPWDLSTADEVVPLIGHSGASVLLISRGSERRVRKLAKGASESPRLLSQMRLQQSAHDAGLGTPAIISSGVDGDRAFFEMEYIPGRSLARALMEGDPPEPGELSRFLFGVLDHHRTSEGPALEKRIFSEKLTAISGRCAPVLERLGLADDFAKLVAAVLEGDLEAPQSPGHGDFTFDNILIDKNGRFILIDFDDPGFSSWKLDLAKLMQDVWGRWCLRHLLLESPGSVAAVNALVELDQVRSELTSRILDAFPVTRPDLARFCLFHLARILPYCQDDRMVLFIMANVRRILAEQLDR